VHVAVGWFHITKIVDQWPMLLQFCQTTADSTQLGWFEPGNFVLDPTSDYEPTGAP
jgi:hypothetical protein